MLKIWISYSQQISFIHYRSTDDEGEYYEKNDYDDDDANDDDDDNIDDDDDRNKEDPEMRQSASASPASRELPSCQDHYITTFTASLHSNLFWDDDD